MSTEGFRRDDVLFSLCGLNCSLCPMYVLAVGMHDSVKPVLHALAEAIVSVMYQQSHGYARLLCRRACCCRLYRTERDWLWV